MMIEAIEVGSTAVPSDRPKPWRRVKVEPVTLQVIGGAFRTIAAQMAQVLFRMAYSNIMRESQDIGCGLLDVLGRQICESESTPMHCGSLPAYIRGIDRKLAGKYRPGDVILHNHPYFGASHSPDYGVIIPVFHGGVHVGFTGCTGHMIDVGGSFPGFSVDVPDLFAEGKLVNAARIYEAGKRNDDLWAHIMENVRTPEANEGDVEAMIACTRFGAQRFDALMTSYGIDTVMSAAEDWMDYAERRLREAIAQVKPGRYPAPQGFIEDDGKNWNKPLAVATAVEVKDSAVLIDLTGSNDQVETGFNCPFEGSVLPTANFAIRTLFLDEALERDHIPQNDGIFRPISVRAPHGSIYNPVYPHGCEARFVQINRIPDQVLQAFANAMPQRVTAGNTASVSALAYSGFEAHKQQYWVTIEINEGAYGGRYGLDGIDAIDNLMANTRNNPVEEIELRSPMLCERYELRDDPPAAGQWRGGLGVIKRWRFLADTGFGSTGDHRAADPPRGLFGGEDGRPGRLTLNPGRNSERALPAKVSNHKFATGDVLEVVLPCAAGYGDPARRDPEAVLRDVEDGLVTPEDARGVYKVVIEPGAGKLDRAATDALRK
jgi:N-methylhydantoinase B/oxoprolinase/acetone carboxylase alpha subunit